MGYFTILVLLSFVVAGATESENQNCPADGCPPGAADPEASSMEVTLLQRPHRAPTLQDEQAESDSETDMLEKRKLDLLQELALIDSQLDGLENASAEECAAPDKNCLSSKCCLDKGTGCYKKDNYWAQCLQVCVKGKHDDDPAQYRTPWSCELVGDAPDPSKTTTTTTTCAPSGGNCKDALCCADPMDGCYEKNQFYARCMPYCRPGYNWMDPPKYAGDPWTCKHLGGAPAPKTLPSDKINTTAELPSFVGVGYNSDAHRSGKPGASNHISCDDFMADWSEPLWGPSKRNDLKTIADMGFNAVRTYGIGAHLSHKKFLDEAHSLGLKVHPGFADYPYLHLGSSCKAQQEMPNVVTDCIRNSNYDCHDVIKAFYLEKLKGGFAIKNDDGNWTYHPAILTITVINECELKLSNWPLMKPLGQNMEHAKVVVTAADGILSAEKELGITGPRPILTATASYAACKLCRSVQVHFPGVDEGMPALPWMADYYLGFNDPESTMGYTAKNDLKQMYTTRWVNSFNTQRPADSFCANEKQVLKAYTGSPLGKVPIFIGEFHDENLPPASFGEDIDKINKYVANDVGDICGAKENPLSGYNLFEFQISYWKGKDAEGGIALKFGLFGLGWRWLGKTNQDQRSVGWEQNDIWCLCPARAWTLGDCARKSDDTNVAQVINKLGGKWPDDTVFCDGWK